MAGDLHDQLLGFSREATGIAGKCLNEESTKLSLVLPFVRILGYDYQNPNDVIPEHAADFSDKYRNKVDFALVSNGEPSIAIECKSVGSKLREDRGQLRSYFNAMGSVRVGVLTNGIDYEFYVDSEEPNIMDDDPFFTLNVADISSGKIRGKTLRHLTALTKENYNPETVLDSAKRQLLHDHLVDDFLQELKSPSDDLCRYFLQKFDVTHLSKKAIDEVYRDLVKAAFEEALAAQILKRLKLDGVYAAGREQNESEDDSESRIVTTNRELSIYAYCKRRLAFLVQDNHHFVETEKIGYKDYVSKFVVYYDKSKKGRLFEYIEGDDGYDTFIFPDEIGEFRTNNILELDKPLLETFQKRVQELAS